MVITNIYIRSVKNGLGMSNVQFTSIFLFSTNMTIPMVPGRKRTKIVRDSNAEFNTEFEYGIREHIRAPDFLKIRTKMMKIVFFDNIRRR
jgi:hypothetical protein